MPSLQTPTGWLEIPVEKLPRTERSAAFQRDTESPEMFVTRMRSPSKAACAGEARPLPVKVASRAPLVARTTDTEPDAKLGTQMFAPSKAGSCGPCPTVTVWRTA